MGKLYRGYQLTTTGSITFSCERVAELFPEIFPVENNYEELFSEEDFKKCCGQVEMLPCGSLLWIPGTTKEHRFDNVRVFISGRNPKRWKNIV